MIERVGLILASIFMAAGFTAATSAPTDNEVRAAVTRALPLLEKGTRDYLPQRSCFSCHHQTLPMLALTTARDRGFAVDAKNLDAQVKHTAEFLRRSRAAFLRGDGTGGKVDTAGHALWMLEMGNTKPDDTTSPVAEFILTWNGDLDHWQRTSIRPPTEASDFTTTAVALRALQTFAIPAQKERATKRIAQAREWLLRATPLDTEDRVSRLWGLKHAGADREAIQAAAQSLQRTQCEDGGWAQTSEMTSDAYATGSSLVALHLAGGVPTSDAAYQHGLKYLMKTQLEDGTWHVRSRSKPFQEYFESGFPHGADQFISISATSWATTALALACSK